MMMGTSPEDRDSTCHRGMAPQFFSFLSLPGKARSGASVSLCVLAVMLGTSRAGGAFGEQR